MRPTFVTAPPRSAFGVGVPDGPELPHGHRPRKPEEYLTILRHRVRPRGRASGPVNRFDRFFEELRRLPPRRISIALTCVAVASACEEVQPDAGIVVRDSAGIQIVENPARAPLQLNLRDATAMLEVGLVEGDAALQFSNVVGAVVTSSGTLVVANGDSNELQFIDGDGSFLKSVGRTGEGPGEFAGLSGLTRRGDSLIVSDGRLGRISVFHETGDFVRATPPGAPFFGMLGAGEGVSYAVAERRELTPGTAARAKGFLIRHALTGERIDTISDFLLNENWLDPDVPGFSSRVFGKVVMTAFGSDRVLVADNTEAGVREVERTGRVRRHIRRTGGGRAVTDVDVQRYIDVFGARYEGAPAAAIEFRVGPIRNQPPPATMPAVGRSELVRSRLPWILIDQLDQVWTLDYLAFPDDPATWSVYDTSGRLLTSVRVPDRFEITYVGEDRIVGLWRDELDVEYIRVYAFPGPEPLETNR